MLASYSRANLIYAKWTGDYKLDGDTVSPESRDIRFDPGNLATAALLLLVQTRRSGAFQKIVVTELICLTPNPPPASTVAKDYRRQIIDSQAVELILSRGGKF